MKHKLLAEESSKKTDAGLQWPTTVLPSLSHQYTMFHDRLPFRPNQYLRVHAFLPCPLTLLLYFFFPSIISSWCPTKLPRPPSERPAPFPVGVQGSSLFDWRLLVNAVDGMDERKTNDIFTLQ